MEPVMKNQRRLAVRTLHGSLSTSKLQIAAKLQAAYKAVTSDQPLTLLPSLSRRERNANKYVDSTERANREKNERERYSILLCDFIKEADLPVISEIRDWPTPRLLPRGSSGREEVRLCEIAIVRGRGTVSG